MAWAPDYVTSSEVKAYLRITHSDDDALVAVWATTASRAVDQECGRQFGQVDAPEARTYEATYDRESRTWSVEIDDVQDVTGFAVADEASAAAASWTLLPRNAPTKGKPYTRLVVPSAGLWTVTARWGWSAVPVPVRNAALLQAARLSARRDSPHGISGSPSEGGELRVLAQVDPDLRVALRGYRRLWWAA